MNVSKHPVMKVPHLVRDYEAIAALAAENPCSFQDAYLQLLTEREKIIKQMAADPLAAGWEPGIWAVCDALLGLKVFVRSGRIKRG